MDISSHTNKPWTTRSSRPLSSTRATTEAPKRQGQNLKRWTKKKECSTSWRLKDSCSLRAPFCSRSPSSSRRASADQSKRPQAIRVSSDSSRCAGTTLEPLPRQRKSCVSLSLTSSKKTKSMFPSKTPTRVFTSLLTALSKQEILR